MRKRLLDRAGKEYPPGQRLLALAAEGVFFVIILPTIVALAGVWLDRALKIGPLAVVWPLLAPGPIMITLGFALALWSIVVQFTIGRGTPAPLMATQTLIVRPPYTYTRNPMALGTIAAYLGLGLLLASPAAIGIVLLLAGLLLAYIKVIKEQEMVLRFGQEYLEYRRKTPFLFPRRPPQN